MILVYGRNPVGNVIHAVLGPESELWTDLHGSLTVDITSLLAICDERMPVLLNVTRCGSEAKLSQSVGAAISSGLQYPFLPGTTVFSPSGDGKPAGPVIDGAKQAKGARPIGPHGNQPQEDNLRTVKVPRGHCARCNDKNAELVPGLSPAICFSCAKIDLYKARKENPTSNGDVKLPPEFS